MINVKTAEEIINTTSKILQTEILPLENCLNLCSAEDVFATMDVPSFNNSAMDGYVFKYEEFLENPQLKLTAEITAGISELPYLKKGETARIFTGAPIPNHADTVVAQEDVIIENQILTLTKTIYKGQNVRLQASQTKKGSKILEKNTLLTAEYIGFLATFGIKELCVYKKPKVGIIVTGTELVKPGYPLEPYQIYESNSVFLSVALKEMGIEPVFRFWVKDDEVLLKNAILNHINLVDVLLFTGGISVGDYDFVRPILKEIGTEEFFYKIKQKPGKPLFYGKLNSCFIFGLPGNPSAVVTIFHVYIKPFLKSIMGLDAFNKKNYGILLNHYSKKVGLTHFLKVKVENHKIEVLNNQNSYQMDAFTKANAIGVFREEQEDFQIGEKIEIINF